MGYQEELQKTIDRYKKEWNPKMSEGKHRRTSNRRLLLVSVIIVIVVAYILLLFIIQAK